MLTPHCCVRVYVSNNSEVVLEILYFKYRQYRNIHVQKTVAISLLYCLKIQFIDEILVTQLFFS